MPELPEVETTLQGLLPHLLNRTITEIHISQPQLRWPVPDAIYGLKEATILALQRRAKYLLMTTDRGSMIWHLGMSGSMRMLPSSAPAAPHEHIRIVLDDDNSLRYKDPRRFGSLLFTSSAPLKHKLLSALGPEPLSDAFNADYLQQQCKSRKTAIKNLIMNSHIVVGIGNIYACESLFLSGINPNTRAGRISLARLQKLVTAIKRVLQQAIRDGGTTLQDFTRTDGKPGYFTQSLKVYANQGDCPRCGQAIRRIIQGQRSTFYCTRCQT